MKIPPISLSGGFFVVTIDDGKGSDLPKPLLDTIVVSRDPIPSGFPNVRRNIREAEAEDRDKYPDAAWE